MQHVHCTLLYDSTIDKSKWCYQRCIAGFLLPTFRWAKLFSAVDMEIYTITRCSWMLGMLGTGKLKQLSIVRLLTFKILPTYLTTFYVCYHIVDIYQLSPRAVVRHVLSTACESKYLVRILRWLQPEHNFQKVFFYQICTPHSGNFWLS